MTRHNFCENINANCLTLGRELRRTDDADTEGQERELKVTLCAEGLALATRGSEVIVCGLTSRERHSFEAAIEHTDEDEVGFELPWLEDYEEVEQNA